MTALILSLLGQFWPFILAAVAALGWGAYRERQGVKKERAKQAQAELEAHETANEIQNEVYSFPDAKVRAELERRERK